MACPVNSTTGICDMLSETGSGLGEFSNGAVSNGGLPRFIMTLAVIGGLVGLLFAVIVVIKKSISGHQGKRV